jgi:hypothetical protein
MPKTTPVITYRFILLEVARRYENNIYIFSNLDESGIDNFKSVPAAILDVVKDTSDANMFLFYEVVRALEKHLNNSIYRWNDDDDRTEENIIETLIKVANHA